MIQGEITKERMEGWKFDSSCEEGFHEIIAPGKADCEQEYIYRLNLSAGKSFDLETGKLEMDAVCIKGAADFSWDGYAGKYILQQKKTVFSTLQVLLMKDMENHFSVNVT